MRKVYSKVGFLATLLLLLCLSAGPCRALAQSRSTAVNTELPRRLQRALVDLPSYSVFDYVTFRIADGRIVLLGNVIRPELKQQAEQAVRAVPGVSVVQNEIEVLPASEQDDAIRHKLYEHLNASPYFTWYAVQAVAPVHIIVKNGRVSLEGFVSRASDRFLVESVISEVTGTSTVENHLLANNDEHAEISELRTRLQ